MMTYTDEGILLINNAIASGTKIQFQKVRIVADPNRSTNELTRDIENIVVDKKDETTIIIKAVIDNNNSDGDYYFNEIYVYAVGTEAEEVLFCFERTSTCPIYIPKYDGRPVQSEISIYLEVSSTDSIEIKDGVYVLQTDFEKRMQKTCNIQVIRDNEEIERENNTWYFRVMETQSEG